MDKVTIKEIKNCHMVSPKTYIEVTVHRPNRFYLGIYMHTYVHACGDQGSAASGVILQQVSTLVFETGSLTGTWGS